MFIKVIRTLRTLVIFFKMVGYLFLAWFLYIEFLGPSGLEEFLGNFGVTDIKKESMEHGFIFISERLVYTSIVVAILEVVSNALEVEHTLK